MKILTLISKLIDYPTQDLYDAAEDVKEYILADDILSDEDKAGLVSFIEGRRAMDILDWQSDYDSLFERGRSLSLLLFEHIHGESRDRGQAMINLIAEYKKAGLDIGVRELPDYIPLYLEFVSTQADGSNDENARGWLQDVSHIFALLHVRLRQRDCDYAALFSALVRISQADINFDDLAAQVKGEKRDDTKEAIDKVWEEEMVKFGATEGGAESQQGLTGGASACDSAINKPSPSQSRAQEVPISMMNQSQFMDAAVQDAVLAETLAKDATKDQSASIGGN